MVLTEQDQCFLAQRASFLSSWPWVGAVLLALLPLMTLLCLTLAGRYQWIIRGN